MIMSFFKKVMTFFSVIWNAILWRKTVKTKKTRKSSEEEKHGHQRLDAISDSEQSLFVEVPLHSPVTDFSIEPDQYISSEDITQPCIPIVAHSLGGHNQQGSEFDFSTRTSFYSEPIRNVKHEVILCSKEKRELIDDRNEDSVKSTEVVGFEENEIPSDGDLKHDLMQGHASVSENILDNASIAPFEPGSHANDPSACINNHNSRLEERIVADQSDERGDHPENRNMIAEKCDVYHNETLRNEAQLCKVPSRTDDSIISHDVHLFEHDDFPNLTGIMNKDCADKTTSTSSLQECGETFNFLSSTMIGSPEGGRSATNNDLSESSNDNMGVGVSVSSTQNSASGLKVENVENEMGKYSTNYLVKSDSLVNFFPVSQNDPVICHLNDQVDSPSEQTEKAVIPGEGNDMKIKESNVVMESCLDELMCTPRGILRLSGDHELDDVVKAIHSSCCLETTLDDFINDVFAFEQPSFCNRPCEEVASITTPIECDFTSDEPNLFHDAKRNLTMRLSGADSETHGLENQNLPEVDGRIQTSAIDDKPALEEFFTDVFSFGNQHFEKPSPVATPVQPDLVTDGSSSSQNHTDVISIADSHTEASVNRCSADNFKGNSKSLPEEYSLFSNSFGVIPSKQKCVKRKLLEDHNDEGCHRGVGQVRSFYDDEPSSCSGVMNSCDAPLSSTVVVMRGNETSSSEIQEFTTVPEEDEDTQISTTNQFFVDSIRVPNIHNSPFWHISLPLAGNETISDVITGGSTQMRFMSKHESTSSCPFDKLSSVPSVDEGETEVVEHLNSFYPFVNCSSFLFRIPKEIRKEGAFNPCVGMAPSLPQINEDMTRTDEEKSVEMVKYPNVNLTDEQFVGPIPLVGTCANEDYKITGVPKLPDECAYPLPFPQNCTGVWGSHPGIVHGDQQLELLSYPLACAGNIYDEVNAIPTEPYENDQPDTSNPPESFGYVNSYGQIEFPLLNIPLCAPQTPSSFMSRGNLGPIIFPLGAVTVAPNENLLMNSESTGHTDDQYSISQSFWGRYQSEQMPSLESEGNEEKQLETVVGEEGLTQAENLSIGTNEDDIDSPLVDPFFHLNENTSLHTVRSKEGSYTASLFCESLRSVISHNTENDCIFPSFSCSSVPGSNPSAAVLQTCETAVSNDSLPSIIVEESTYTKTVDDDYLATEKFMNDVNTALNESVMDQIQGRLDHLQSNLLGRGDGSIAVEPDTRERADLDENLQIDVMLGNSPEGNLSVNNSKLTLLDGALGTEGDSVKFDSLHSTLDQFSEKEDKSDGVTYVCCLDILDAILASVVTTANHPHPDHDLNVTNGENHKIEETEDDLHSATETETNVVVQHSEIVTLRDNVNHIFMEGFSYQKQHITDVDEGELCKLDINQGHEETLHNIGEKFDIKREFSFGGKTTSAVENSSKSQRRIRRRRKKLSGNLMDLRTELTEIGDGIGSSSPCGNELESHNPQISHETSKSGDQTSNPCGGDEVFTNNSSLKPEAKNEETVQEGAADHYEEDEEGDAEELEQSASSLSNRKRRNRRKKRKN